MLRLADRLPCNWSVDAIYVPGFCLTYNKQRLTALNKACMQEAIRQMQGGAKYFIFSGCYSGKVLERELTLRRELAGKAGFGGDTIQEISGITSTYNEITKLAPMLNTLNVKSLLLVSDKYHIPRLVRLARLRLPAVEIFHVSVQPPAYEFAWEPNLIKTIRSGIKPLWILWNVLLYIATFLLRR